MAGARPVPNAFATEAYVMCISGRDPLDGFPKPPKFSDEFFEECRASRDSRPLLFEWFKFFGLLALSVASIARETVGYRSVPSLQKAVVEGLANRSSRLMLSIGKLSCDGLGGESAAILARSVVESAIILRWLTESDNPDDVFRRYVAGGLKADLVLEDHIESCIAERNGCRTVREKRMLDSIQRSRDDANFTREEIERSKGMPDMKTIMTKSLGMEDAQYIGVQRMLSQFVHGTWSDLRSHYIEKQDNGTFRKKDVEEAPLHPNLLLLSAVVVSEAVQSVFRFFVGDDSLTYEFGLYVEAARQGVFEADKIKSLGDEDII